MFDFLAKGKDAMIVSALRTYFDSQLRARYGELQDLQVDTDRRTLTLVLMPRGEIRAISIRILEYKIDRQGGGLYLIPGRASIDRAWMQALYEDLAQNQRFELPSIAAGFL
ncbi:MAG: hypothetical protein JSR82_02790 [Verrucomicrobia bacterium]|nr:hypothetical protein [Verrucomicrobiota bacterium]